MATPANVSTYAPTSWGSGEALKDFTTPSGQVCQIRMISIETLAAEGILDQLDVLTNSVALNVIGPAQGKRPMDHQKKRPTKAEAAALAEAESTKTSADAGIFGGFTVDQIIPLIDTVNRAVCEIVVQPQIQRPVRKDEDGEEHMLGHDERESGIVYTDTIPLNDRMALFQTSFGDIGSLASFRDESDKTVGDVADE